MERTELEGLDEQRGYSQPLEKAELRCEPEVMTDRF